MVIKNTSVFGLYPSFDSAKGAVDALRVAGFHREDISVVFPPSITSNDFANVVRNSEAPEVDSASQTTGAVVGESIGWLFGLGSVTLPGLEPFIAAGPIMTAFSSTGTDGAVGGIAGALIDMGLPENEAKRFEGQVNQGGILLSVHLFDTDSGDRAKGILEVMGGEDISLRDNSHADVLEADNPLRRVG